MDKINWYPGHMKKTKELIQENLSLVGAVCEVLDARIPFSSRNPSISELTSNKKKIIVLTKTDLADPNKLKIAEEKLKKSADFVVSVNANSGEGIKQLTNALLKIENQLNEGRERKKNLRLMIVGIPNVGKSSLINRLAGGKVAKTGDKPGITRGKQWISIEGNMMLLDTPGILWPNLDDQNVALNLAFCGSIKDEIMDIDTLGLRMIERLSEIEPEKLAQRYKLSEIDDDPLVTMEAIAKNRGFILPGKRIDYTRTAKTVLDEFRSATIGRISLE